MESVRTQETDYKVQVIVVNDGSTDGTMKILAPYENIKGWTVVHQANKGHIVGQETQAWIWCKALKGLCIGNIILAKGKCCRSVLLRKYCVQESQISHFAWAGPTIVGKQKPGSGTLRRRKVEQ